MLMITPRHRYEHGYIVLEDLKLPDYPDDIDIQGYHLVKKSEFHISQVCTHKLAKMIDASKQRQIEDEMVKIFTDYVSSHPLVDYTYKNEFRLVKHEDLVTVIVMTDVPGLKELFDIYTDRFGKVLPLQPAHITLYTLPGKGGIGILSQEQLQQESELIEVPFSS